MALTSTLYRFHVDLSDTDRGVYEALDFRVAMHPSENTAFLLSRVIAYLLNYGNGLDFSPGGLSDVDAPALSAKDAGGGYSLWIEIGNPSARKLHRGSKSSRQVKVYTYKDPDLLKKEIEAEEVHRRDTIEIYALPQKFLNALAETLARDNEWNVLFTDGSLTITSGDFSETIELPRL